MAELSPPRILTAFEIGEQSAHKPLGRFGSALVRRPVREGIAMAELGLTQTHKENER